MTTTRVEFTEHAAGGLVATITYDNEAKLNCMDQEAALEFARQVDLASANADVRVMVLRGAGERALIGGADIKFMSTLSPEQAEPFIAAIHLACKSVRRAPVPVIGRLAGYCLGAGLEIAASCDIRIADEGAVLGMPEVQVGLPSVIEAALLPRLIGWGKTSWLVYTGETIDAATALGWGLVEKVVPNAELDVAITSTVDAICRAAPQAIRLQKELCRDWEELPLNDAIERGVGFLPKGFKTGEPQERLAEFLSRKATK